MSAGDQHPYLRLFEQSLTAVRLASYVPEEEAWDDLDVTARYLWNVALCEAWYPSLHILEVIVRNRVDAVMSEHFPLDRTRHAGCCWIDARPSILCAGEVATVDKAVERVARRGGGVTQGRLVAELGFWTSLFDRKYANASECPVPLWPRLEHRMFPLMPEEKRNRPDMSRYLNEVREIRNRAFHCESLLALDLERAHRRMLDLIGWVRPAILPTVRAMDRFPTVFAAGPDHYRKMPEPLAEAARREKEERDARKMTRAQKREAARRREEEGGSSSTPS